MKKIQQKSLILHVLLISSFCVSMLLFLGPSIDGQVQADSDDLSLFVWQTINSGGNYYISSNEEDTLIGTVGQIWAGEMQGDSYDIGIGWACKGSPTKVKEEEGNIPYRFSLSQNYPNPFNSNTIIAYELPNDCEVEVTIYNVLGQKVNTIFKGHQRAGYNQVEWNATNNQGTKIASGLYFYRIQAGRFTDNKRMILLK
jgi:hypothetical protein